ncbi:MAG: S41 family peptidase [Planctomycetota bacterium JB042]
MPNATIALPRPRPTAVLPLAASLWLLLGPSLAAQDDLGEQVAEAVEAMRSGIVSEVYSAAYDLSDLGDATVPLLRRTVNEDDDPWVQLGCLRALVDLDAVDDGAVDRLLELAGVDHEANVRVASLDLIGLLAPSNRIASALADLLDRTYDPHVKASLAKTLYQVGDASRKIRASEELQTLLRSENRDYRIVGALALAEIGALEHARPVLLEIEDDPSLAGRLARSYLKIEKIYRFYENRETRRIREEAEPTAVGGDRLDVLRELIEIVQSEHIQGEEYRGDDGEEKLVTAAAKGLLGELDRHSTYFSPEEYEKWLLDLQRHYAGIGAYVQTIGGFFTITRPIYSGPAFRAGLRSDDRILSVDGWDTYDQPQQDVIDRLKAEPGTKVTVEVMRTGWKKPRKFTITREVIDIPSIFYELFPGDLGYIEAQTFADTTYKELRNALKDLERRGAKGYILDLRSNPGGYMRAAIDMVGEFVGQRKMVVYTEGRHSPQDRREYYTRVSAPGRDEPLVVLINGRSASASEIVSGALRHYDRATLVGQKTFGKGSVQNPFGLRTRPAEEFADKNGNDLWDPDERFVDANGNGKYDYGAMFKLTTQLYYLPNGTSVHTIVDADGKVKHEGGIAPDVESEYEYTAPWKEEELADLLEEEAFKKYVDDRFDANRDLFVQLAEGDNFDESRYPDFDSFYESLETHLDRNEIRKWLRLHIRYKVCDERKKPFPGNQFYGDYQEDSQLQRAIVELLKKMGRDPKSIPEYVRFAEMEAEPEKEQVRLEGE